MGEEKRMNQKLDYQLLEKILIMMFFIELFIQMLHFFLIIL